jgi:Ran GTPase-activating protein (RanGAP) involved in mRNA processing and transport
LNLNSCAICGIGTRYLIVNCWKNLKSLFLRDNKIDNRGVAELVKCAFNQLRNLNLGFNFLTDSCIKPLVKGWWPYLEYLVLSGNMIEDEGIRVFSTGNFSRLKTLEISSGSMITSRPPTQISMGGLKNLVKGEWRKVNLVICKPQTKKICNLLIFS